MPVRSVASLSEPYVSVAQLCEHWAVSRNEIYKQIEAGTLPAVRLGPRLYRIRREDAVRFEERARLLT